MAGLLSGHAVRRKSLGTTVTALAWGALMVGAMGATPPQADADPLPFSVSVQASPTTIDLHPTADPREITNGPRGSLWFTEPGMYDGRAAIGRIVVDGSCAPVHIVKQRAIVSKKGRTSVRLRCGAGAAGCAGTLNLTVRVRRGRRLRTVNIGAANYVIRALQRPMIAVILSAAGRRLLTGALHHELNVRASAAGAWQTINLAKR